MEIKLITYGDDAVWKRKTVMGDGKQIGYVNDAPGSPVLATVPLDDDERAQVAEEVARIKACQQGEVVVPVFVEAAEFDDWDEDEQEGE
jgi:hypothetical protein